MAKPFFESGLSQLRYHTECFSVEGDTVKCVVDVTGSKGCGFRHKCEYIFGEDGSVTMKNKVVPYGVMPELPRLGLSMRLPKSLGNVRWYGRGPHENYIDRAMSAFFGVWSAKVPDLFVEYARPQDNGYRTGVGPSERTRRDHESSAANAAQARHSKERLRCLYIWGYAPYI